MQRFKVESQFNEIKSCCLAVNTDKATSSHISGVISEQMGKR